MDYIILRNEVINMRLNLDIIEEWEERKRFRESEREYDEKQIEYLEKHY